MCFRPLACATLAFILSLIPAVSSAQPPAAGQPHSGSARTAAWTVAAIGGGFGIGLLVGLSAFDDASDSDRKVWTTAIVGAAAGGALAYLLGRSRHKSAPSRTASTATGSRTARRIAPPLEDRELRALAASVSLPGRSVGEQGRGGAS